MYNRLSSWGINPVVMAGMASNAKVYALEEVAKHNNKEECWIIVSGKVSFMAFVNSKPGPAQCILGP
jgi:cytochrome b involved in lipid metabolism